MGCTFSSSVSSVSAGPEASEGPGPSENPGDPGEAQAGQASKSSRSRIQQATPQASGLSRSPSASSPPALFTAPPSAGRPSKGQQPPTSQVRPAPSPVQSARAKSAGEPLDPPESSAPSGPEVSSPAVISSVPSALSVRLNPRERFELQPGTLGKGHFAKVKKAKDHLTGRLVAIKIIDKKELVKNRAIVKGEIEILKAVGCHPNVVSLIDQFEDNHKFYLVMELCAGGDLFSRIVEHGKYSEAQAVSCCKQLALALQHIHKCGVTHRDLKPENILLVSPSLDSPIKIGDFGLSKLIRGHENVMRTVCGTWAYVAPEVITRKPYSSTVDNWSLGVLMYILLSGYHPFDVYGELPEPELLQRIVGGTFDFDDPVWSACSSEAKDLIKGLLQLDASKRLSLSSFLSSPWITGAERANTEPLPIVVDRLSKFQVTKPAFRTLVVAKLASNKFKASLSRSSRSQAPQFGSTQAIALEPNSHTGTATGGDNSLTEDFIFPGFNADAARLDNAPESTDSRSGNSAEQRKAAPSELSKPPEKPEENFLQQTEKLVAVDSQAISTVANEAPKEKRKGGLGNSFQENNRNEPEDAEDPEEPLLSDK